MGSVALGRRGLRRGRRLGAPRPAVQTYQSGAMRDSLEGLGASAYDQVFGRPLTAMTGKNWMTDRGSVYGNEEAFQTGRAVGDATGFVMNAMITASGVGGAVKGVVTGIRAVQAAGGAVHVAQLLTDAGRTVNVVMVNGRAVEATAMSSPTWAWPPGPRPTSWPRPTTPGRAVTLLANT